MATKTKSEPKLKAKTVEFEFVAPEAQAVFLAGSFNEWNAEATPMAKKPKGKKWTVKLKLLPGRYEYKFLCDGQWRCSANGEEAQEDSMCVPNEFGTMNRVIVVE